MKYSGNGSVSRPSAKKKVDFSRTVECGGGSVPRRVAFVRTLEKLYKIYYKISSGGLNCDCSS